MGNLPPPHLIGMPEKFQSWYPNQCQSLNDIIQSDSRFILLTGQTGFGKSLAYMMLSRFKKFSVSGDHTPRIVTLTETKKLQSQLMGDFKKVGLVDIRGRNAYKCQVDGPNIYADTGPCTMKIPCDHKKSRTCPYYAAVDRATRAKLVTTNYAYWLYSNRFGEGIGKADILVCDEAHGLPDTLTNFLTIKIAKDSEIFAPYFPIDWENKPLKAWKLWAATTRPYIEHDMNEIEQEGDRKQKNIRFYNQLKNALMKLTIIDAMDEIRQGWVYHPSHYPSPAATFFPIFPAAYAENSLFRNTPYVILVSASIRPKTAELLGVKDHTLLEYPSTIPLANRPLYCIKSVRMNHRATDSDLRFWLSKIDAIIGNRLDRKGIIHTVSYKRRNFILANSRHSGIMMSHSDKDAEYQIKAFKRAKPPAVLVSPSVHTGMDFPNSECEYQIISKLPYPDSRDPIVVSRNKIDPTYTSYVAMQGLVQMCGRACRSPEDKCENFIVDDNVRWFIPRNKEFAPEWFLGSVKWPRTIPNPPEKL